MCMHIDLNKERLLGNQSFLVVGLPWGTEDDNMRELGDKSLDRPPQGVLEDC